MITENTLKNSIDKIQQGAIDNINTIAIAKITKIDNKKMICNIKLLDMIEFLGTRDEVEEIENVPILPLFWNEEIKSNAMYKVNDKVIVLFCQHATFNARNSDDPVIADHFEKYSLNNALVVGHMRKDSDINEYPEDYYIKHNNTLFRIEKEKVTIETKDVELKINDTVKVTSTDFLGNSSNSFKYGTDTVDIKASSIFKVTSPTIKFIGAVEITDTLKVNGDVNFLSNLAVVGNSTSADFISGSITLNTHKHTTTMASTGSRIPSTTAHP